MHYFTSMSRAMKGSRHDCALDNDDEDYEELSEPEAVQNEQARIWLDGSYVVVGLEGGKQRQYRDIG
jgi:hypothetical protein